MMRLKINDWWTNMMFGYVYADGASESKDPRFEKELHMIAAYYRYHGYRYCTNCETWMPSNAIDFSCDF